jgi:hypothetical protein
MHAGLLLECTHHEEGREISSAPLPIEWRHQEGTEAARKKADSWMATRVCRQNRQLLVPSRH